MMKNKVNKDGGKNHIHVYIHIHAKKKLPTHTKDKLGYIYVYKDGHHLPLHNNTAILPNKIKTKLRNYWQSPTQKITDVLSK